MLAPATQAGAEKHAREDDETDPALLSNSNLPSIFDEVDADGTGQIDYDEFLKGFGLDATPLCSKIFFLFLFDEDHSC